jgi:hypothetical protein
MNKCTEKGIHTNVTSAIASINARNHVLAAKQCKIQINEIHLKCPQLLLFPPKTSG